MTDRAATIQQDRTMQILEFDKRIHAAGLRECFIELQDFERAIDPRMPGGADIAGDYIPAMMNRCRECQGKIFVAEVDGSVAGYATVLTKVRSDEPTDADVEYGFISDLVVLQKFRRQGLGRRLLDAVEAYSRSRDVQWLRIGFLAGNQAAHDLYRSAGFANLYRELEKDLRRSQHE
jgi:ribosomal protein S18 acetylase RimI-like enzyme